MLPEIRNITLGFAQLRMRILHLPQSPGGDLCCRKSGRTSRRPALIPAIPEQVCSSVCVFQAIEKRPSHELRWEKAAAPKKRRRPLNPIRSVLIERPEISLIRREWLMSDFNDRTHSRLGLALVCQIGPTECRHAASLHWQKRVRLRRSAQGSRSFPDKSSERGLPDLRRVSRAM